MRKSPILAVLVLVGACLFFTGCVDDTLAPIVDEAPVLPPENVTASPSATSKIVIQWDPNAHPMLRGYHVYRVETDTQESVRLTSSPIVDTHYGDPTALRGIGYQYRVTAVTKSGRESAYASVPVMLQAEDRQDPKVHS